MEDGVGVGSTVSVGCDSGVTVAGGEAVFGIVGCGGLVGVATETRFLAIDSADCVVKPATGEGEGTGVDVKAS